MAKQTINIGTIANDRSGDPLRTAFNKINENFTELYNTLATELSAVNQSIVPVTDNLYDLGSPTNRFRHLYVAPGTIYLGDIKLTNNAGKLDAVKVINPGEDTEEIDTEDSDALSQVRGEAFNQTLNTDSSVTFGQVDTPLLNFGQYPLSAPVVGGFTDKLRLYNFEDSQKFNYALGVEANHLWLGVDVASAQTGFKFYGADTEILSITGDGKIHLAAGGDIVDSNGVSVLGGGGSTTKSWTNPNENVWTIEEYSGGTTIQYTRTATATYSTSSTVTQSYPDVITIDYSADATIADILNNTQIQSVEINGTTYSLTGGYSYGGNVLNLPAAGITYNPGDVATLTYVDWTAPLQPVLWFDPANSPSGNNNFRGAIIEYHAYCSSGGTVIGKIMISRDWQAVASHEEVTAGSSELSLYEFWNLGNNNGNDPGRLYLYINDPSNPNRTDNSVMIQWTSNIFYGSEAWC